MPLYDYRCAECDSVFEQRRPMGAADEGVRCPDGHARVKRLLSVFASARAGAGSPAPLGGGGGAPCGAACGCH